MLYNELVKDKIYLVYHREERNFYFMRYLGNNQWTPGSSPTSLAFSVTLYGTKVADYNPAKDVFPCCEIEPGFKASKSLLKDWALWLRDIEKITNIPKHYFNEDPEQPIKHPIKVEEKIRFLNRAAQ